MAAPNKLTDPQMVAQVLKEHKTKKAAARALGVSRQALYRYTEMHIEEICEYIVKPAVIDTHAKEG